MKIDEFLQAREWNLQLNRHHDQWTAFYGSGNGDLTRMPCSATGRTMAEAVEAAGRKVIAQHGYEWEGE